MHYKGLHVSNWDWRNKPGMGKGRYYLNKFEMQSTSWLAILKKNYKVALIVVVKRHLPTTTLFNYLFAFHLHQHLCSEIFANFQAGQ